MQNILLMKNGINIIQIYKQTYQQQFWMFLLYFQIISAFISSKY